VIGRELEGVTDACDAVEGAWVANDNSPGQVVIAGTLHGVEDAGAAALKRGAKRVIPLQVGGAFHTPLMQPAQASLDAALAAAEFAPTPLPVVANVDASPHTDDFRDLLSAQLCSQVRWRDSLVALAGTGANLFVELGPGTELSGMVRRTVPDVARLNVAGPEDLEALASAINS
jgi:[acyl-carrier-protein] S-malonyltransferase